MIKLKNKQERTEFCIPLEVKNLVKELCKDNKDFCEAELGRIFYINGIGRFIHHWSLKNKEKIVEVVQYQKIHNETTWMPIILDFAII